MIQVVRTNSKNKDFITLVASLDKDLAIRDGNDHAFYAQFNKIDAIKYVVVAYEDNKPLGCGALKQYDEETAEIKRMFTSEKNRGKGIATKVLIALELWAKELSFKKCILETGVRQPEAINLYKKNNYKLIKNYGQYADIKDSVCFQKIV